MYGADTSGWEHLATYPVQGALPAMPARIRSAAPRG